jgi:FAD/FMN-containing dehydrogenase
MTVAVSETLADDFRGTLLSPDADGYDQARALYNGMIDKRPALIARCADVADVIRAVDHARRASMLLAVRGGGHNGAGLGSCDDGLVLDLSGMRGIRVDPEAATVRVQGVAPGVTSTTPRMPSVWPLQPASSRLPEWAG